MTTLGQRVEVGVCGGVAALTGTAEGAGGRGEHDEGREVGPLGQLVQVRRRQGLGGEGVLHLLDSERFDRRVVEHSGGVDYGTKRVLLAGIEPISCSSCSRSATSQAAIRTFAPSSWSIARRSVAPSAPSPERLASSR